LHVGFSHGGEVMLFEEVLTDHSIHVLVKFLLLGGWERTKKNCAETANSLPLLDGSCESLSSADPRSSHGVFADPDLFRGHLDGGQTGLMSVRDKTLFAVPAGCYRVPRQRAMIEVYHGQPLVDFRNFDMLSFGQLVVKINEPSVISQWD